MKRIAITPAMVNAVESAIHFAHGYEVGGHLAMLRAMSRRGLIKNAASALPRWTVTLPSRPRSTSFRPTMNARADAVRCERTDR
jgi:hypothetical protein